MEKVNVKGHSRILALSLMLLTLIALSGADDKNKKPENTPPPKRSPQVTRQAPSTRATPPPQKSSTTNTYHPPNTNNPYHPPNTGTSTGNKSTGNATSTTGGNTNNKTYTYTPNPNKTYTPANNTGSTNKGWPANSRSNDHDRFGNNGRPVSTTAHNYQPVRTTREFGDKHVAYDRGGHMRDIHARGIDVHRSARGTTTFVAERNGRRIVGLGPRRGYIQRGYVSRNGSVYVQRTYVVGGVRYARVYRSYYWHGAVYYHYAPVVYYRPAFYVWAYRPWPARVVWTWGWGPSPWYGYYGYYFAPYPVYPSASFWLTDYLLAQNLQLAYAAQQNAEASAPPPDAGGPPPNQEVQLTPEVKQMIADEVQRQLAAEQAAAGAPNTSSSAPPTGEETPSALDPNSRIFVVSNNLDVVKDDGSECTLTAGDVILRTGTAPDGTKMAVNVITSKRDDCPSNTNTAIEVSDLQEMQNQFREQIDSGLKVMADNQGKNGLPAAPDTTTTTGEVAAPSPDSSAEADLEDQQKNAEQTEADVQKAGGGGGPQN